MTGRQKYDETAQKIKTAVETEKAQKATAQTSPVLANGAYPLSDRDEEFKKLMAMDARREQEQNGASLPFLKVYIASRSIMTLADGSTPNHGWFVYTPTRRQYKEVHVRILSISRGFRMPGMADDDGVVKNKWNHIIAGLLLNDEELPFWLFISGQQRVQKLWEFEKQLREMNQKGFPTFTFLVKLKTEPITIDRPNGKKAVATLINYELETDENGEFVRIATMEEYKRVRNKVYEQEQNIKEYIGRKEVVEEEKPVKLAEIEPDQTLPAPAIEPDAPPEQYEIPM